MTPSENPLVRLAEQAIATYLQEGIILSPDGTLSDDLQKPAASFVSLKKHGNLRGCIGTILPTQPSLALEIIRNAISAATRDPRFPPVTLDELSDLITSVDVLTPPVKVSSLEELDPKQYGVIVKQEGRQGVLLPDLPGIDTVERQIAIALQKAGIRKAHHLTLYKFKVTRHH